MKITTALKSWVVENCDVKSDADDDKIKKTAADSLIEGKLTAEKYAELTADPEAEKANEFSKKFDAMTDVLAKLVEAQTKAPEKPTEEKKEEVKEEKSTEEKPAEEKKQEVPVSKMAKMVAEISGQTEDSVKDIEVRVKEAAEMYDTTRSNMVYPTKTKQDNPHIKAGQPVMDYANPGRQLETASERDKAINGAWWKLLTYQGKFNSRKMGYEALTNHEKELVLYAMDNEKWVGSTTGENYEDIKERKLYQSEKQALIDDAVSGGLEAAPIRFDDDVISAPLLTGELFPKVKIVPVERGRRMEAVATLNITMAWGGIDNTAITLFNTAAYVTAFDTTIYRVEGAVRIGLDFLSDTPINFGAHIGAQYGERLLEELDGVVATGNGTTQPQGIMNAAGTTTVAWGGVTNLGNYETTRFSVAKAEHTAAVKSSAVFCGTEVSYRRAKAIPVGAADERRLLGEGGMGTAGYSNYQIMGEIPYAINESMANTQIFYAILARYRMYRRRGFTMRVSTEGATNILRNVMLMVVTARFGGQLERGATAAVSTTAPA